MKKMRKQAIGVGIILASMIAFDCNAYAAGGKLYLDVHFIENFFFNKYDVDIYLDDNKVDTIPNGVDYSKLLEDVDEGKHILSFVDAEDDSVKGVYDFKLDGDMTFKCTLLADTDEVDISEVDTIDNLDASQLEVADYRGQILSSATKALKEEGFKNVKSEAEDDSIWDEDNWLIVDQNVDPGSKQDQNAEIVLTCVKTQERLDEAMLGKDIPDALSAAEDFGFEVTFINGVMSEEMDTRVSDMTDDEQKTWKVDSIEPDGTGEKKADLILLCYGEKKVPNTIGMSLSEALDAFKKEDFSSVEYETASDDVVWDEDNWKVLAQSVDAGTMRAADQKITLTVDSYDNLSKQSEENSVVPEETQVPETQALETRTPETQAPETQVPETQAPETQPPETQAPETQAPETQTPETQAPETQTPETDLNIDFSSPDTIIAVQEALNAAGYDCGTADGVAGEKTKNAIESFRADNGLAGESDIDGELINKLGIAGTLSSSTATSEFSEEEAKRAIIVSLSNYFAEDVFTEDGNDYDPSKFHSYESGSDFILKTTDAGEWSKNEDSWHVSGMKLQNSYGNYVCVSEADVSVDEQNAVISNLKGTDPSGMDLEIQNESWAPKFLNIPMELLDYDASDEKSESSESTDSIPSTDEPDSTDKIGIPLSDLVDRYNEFADEINSSSVGATISHVTPEGLSLADGFAPDNVLTIMANPNMSNNDPVGCINLHCDDIESMDQNVSMFEIMGMIYALDPNMDVASDSYEIFQTIQDGSETDKDGIHYSMTFFPTTSGTISLTVIGKYNDFTITPNE